MSARPVGAVANPFVTHCCCTESMEPPFGTLVYIPMSARDLSEWDVPHFFKSRHPSPVTCCSFRLQLLAFYLEISPLTGPHSPLKTPNMPLIYEILDTMD